MAEAPTLQELQARIRDAVTYYGGELLKDAALVTSHSPFVAQAASDNGLIVLKPNPVNGTMEAQQPIESVRGWRVDEILTSDLFGLTETRDEETEQLMRRHAELIGQRAWSQLGKQEQQDLARIEERLGERLTSPGETPEERERFQKMHAFVDQTLKQLEEK